MAYQAAPGLAVSPWAMMLMNNVIITVYLSSGSALIPDHGMQVGSISLVVGPGTAAAWAKEAQAAGLMQAPEVAVAGATLAVIAGAIAA